MKNLLSFAFLFLIGAMFGVTKASACSRLPPPPVLDVFNRSEIVGVASFEGSEELSRTTIGNQVYLSYKAHFLIERSYKGRLAAGQKILVRDGGDGGTCGMGFSGEAIGQKFLFYMGDPQSRPQTDPGAGKGDGLFAVSICSRSKRLERAFADILYLDQMSKYAGKTRLSGTVEIFGDNPPSRSGIEIKVSGAGTERTATTDSNGFFEVWDLPPGNYTVKYAVPAGWKIHRYWVQPSEEEFPRREPPPNSTIQAPIESKRHTEVNTYLTIDNRVSGKVLSRSGKPTEGVCVAAHWLTPTKSTYSIPRSCTEQNGEFSIEQLPPGKYLLEISCEESKKSSKFFYPGVRDKEESQPISVEAGTYIRDLVITMPQRC